jgi:hypothetical protein
VLFIANGPGNAPHNSALGRILSEQDIKMARIADARIAELLERLDMSKDEEFRALQDDLKWLHDTRKTLAGLRQKIMWAIISFVLLGILGFCTKTALDGIREGLRYGSNGPAVSQYPAR